MTTHTVMRRTMKFTTPIYLPMPGKLRGRRLIYITEAKIIDIVLASPGAILFQLGPLTIRWYGVMIALGFLGATLAAANLARRRGLDVEQCLNAALVSFIGGIIGARLYFVALSWRSFVFHPGDILATWKGGGSIHGGLIGGLVCGLIYLRAKRMPLLSCLDIGGVVVPLGQAIGRWGNFFNCEAFGKPVPSGFPLKLYIPPEFRPEAYQVPEFFHPTFLYESVFDLTIFAVFYFFLADRLASYPGATLFLYLAVYSFGRIFIEMLRVDSIMFYGYPAPILASLATIIFALCALIVLFTRYKGRRGSR